MRPLLSLTHYRDLEQRLIGMRQACAGFEHKDEEALVEEMSIAWRALGADEQSMIRSEGPKSLLHTPDQHRRFETQGPGLETAAETHFAICVPALLSLARLLVAARRRMNGPLGAVPDDQLVWLDTERISAIGQGSLWNRMTEVDALLAELVRLDVVEVERKSFVGAEEVRAGFGFRFRPVTAWQPATRDPLRQPAPGDRFRSPSLPNCGRVVTNVTSAGPGTVSYCQVSKDGTVKSDVITVGRDAWDVYVNRMMSF